MATAHFFCPLEGVGSLLAASTAAAPTEAPTTMADAKTKGAAAAGSVPSLAMGCGALVADRQKNWPTTFNFAKSYLHLDELFLHSAPVEYENSDGDIVKLSPGKEHGKLEFHLNDQIKGEVTELRYDQASGRLVQQGDMPLAGSVESRSVVPLKDRDRVMYLLSWLCQENGVPGFPPCEEPLGYVLLVLERPVICPLGSLLIGSKLDFDLHSPNCRMAFFGRMLCPMDPKNLKSLRLVKMKQKAGTLDRFDKQDRTLVICKDMFKADTDMSLFMGLKVVHESSGTEGVLEGMFGQEGKFKVRFPEELKVKTDPKGNIRGDERITLYFKKYNFEHQRAIIQ